MNVENKVLQILSKILSINHKTIRKPESLKWDSLKHISLITAIEEEFNLIFEPEEISDMTSYNKIINILKQKLEIL